MIEIKNLLEGFNRAHDTCETPTSILRRIPERQ